MSRLGAVDDVPDPSVYFGGQLGQPVLLDLAVVIEKHQVTGYAATVDRAPIGVAHRYGKSYVQVGISLAPFVDLTGLCDGDGDQMSDGAPEVARGQRNE